MSVCPTCGGTGGWHNGLEGDLADWGDCPDCLDPSLPEEPLDVEQYVMETLAKATAALREYKPPPTA